VAIALSDEMKIIDLRWPHRSLTTSAVGYPSDSWVFCFVLDISSKPRIVYEHPIHGSSRLLHRLQAPQSFFHRCHRYLAFVSYYVHTNIPFTWSSWLDELARRAGYMLAERASSMFARRLLDVCSMFAMLYACFIFARCLFDVCCTFARCLLDVCSIV